MFRIPGIAKFFAPSGVAAILALSPLTAHAYTQAEAQNVAANTNHHGSDDDQDLAYRNAMMAFMNLAALNIPGAISKGYEAYGNYTNSEIMDDLEAKTKKLRNTMGGAAGSGDMIAGSATSAKVNAESNSGVSGGSRRTTLSNLDPSFMYKGETAKVAEEFEKRSGMKREEFFKHLSSITDAHYNWNDSDLQSKLEDRWNTFKQRVPNKEFLSGLTKAEAMVPDSMRVKMMGEAKEFYLGFYKNDGKQKVAAPNPPIIAVETPKVAEATAPTSSATTDSTPGAAASGERGLASVTGADKEGVYPRSVGLYIGLNQNDDALNKLVQGANAAADGETLFKQVSSRYRKLMPMLLTKKF